MTENRNHSDYFCVAQAKKKSRLYQTIGSVEPALFDSEYGSVDSSKEPAEDGLAPHYMTVKHACEHPTFLGR